tara:strand:- start:686 stop:1219 length:534 start_codon:yes stop_codon:yes gene_type:complete
MSITIVSGSPGSGKTSVSKLLADSDGGVHIESDHFFRFITHYIDPSKPESKQQNETVVLAYTTAAKTYSDAGYSVYLDGVIGPWLFPIMDPVLHSFEYAVLFTPEETALVRVAGRNGQDSAKPSVVHRMHKQFANIIADYQKHVFDSTTQTIQDVASELRRRRSGGELTISLEQAHA